VLLKSIQINKYLSGSLSSLLAHILSEPNEVLLV